MTRHPNEHLLSNLAYTPSGWLATSGEQSVDTEPILLPKVEILMEIDSVPEGGSNAPIAGHIPDSDEWLLSLTDAGALHDLISGILLDLERMAGTLDRKRKGEDAKSRKLSLLQESQKKRMLQQESLDRHKDDGDGILKDIGETTVEYDEREDFTVEELTPSERTQITFNSARCVLPIIRSMVLHPRGRNVSPVLPQFRQGSGKRKKLIVYLLGRSVYGTTTTKEHTSLRKHLEKVTKYFSRMEPSLAPILDPERHSASSVIDRSLGIFLGKDKVHFLKVAKRIDADLISPLVRSDTRLDNLHKASIQRLRKKLSSAIQYKIPEAKLTVYGSCLSDLSLGKNSDVDISLHLPEALELKEAFNSGLIKAQAYEKRMKRNVYLIKGILARSFVDLFAVTRARIPVIKGRDANARSPYSECGSLNFDICFLNDIAVVNSTLIAEYTQIPGVRDLMLSVKAWVKQKNIGAAAESTLSSYTWMVLVIFYLQAIEFVPNLQDRDLMNAHGMVPDPHNNPSHGINGLDTAFLSSEEVLAGSNWERNGRVAGLPTAALLYGFFKYYCDIFPRTTVAVSIRLGKCALQKTSFSRSARLWRLCIEDPFETYFSHFPHDLGVHCDFNGQRRVDSCLRDALQVMERDLNAKSYTGVVMAASLITGASEKKYQSTRKKTNNATDKGGRLAKYAGEPKAKGGGGHGRSKGETQKTKSGASDQNSSPSGDEDSMRRRNGQTQSRDQGTSGRGRRKGKGRGNKGGNR